MYTCIKLILGSFYEKNVAGAVRKKVVIIHLNEKLPEKSGVEGKYATFPAPPPPPIWRPINNDL